MPRTITLRNVLLIGLLTLFTASQTGTVLAGTNGTARLATCTWTGTTSSDWNTAGNWSGGTIPGSSDDVNIPDSGVTNEPSVSSADANVHSLSIGASRTLTIASGKVLTMTAGQLNNSGLVTGPGTFRTSGGVTLIQSGGFNAPLAVVSGEATSASATPVYSSTLTVASGASLLISYNNTMIVLGDVTIGAGGTLYGASGSSTLLFKGTTLHNDGTLMTVALNKLTLAGAGTQTLAGTGTWRGSLLTLSNPTTLLANPLTMEVGSLSIVAGSTLSATQPMTLTYSSVTLNNAGTLWVGDALTMMAGQLTNSGLVTGPGTFRTAGSVTLLQRGGFAAPLVVVSGETTSVNDIGSAVYSSTLTVASGASLLIAYNNTTTVLGDVTIGGTLHGYWSDATLLFKGTTFRNNGAIPQGSLSFGRAGTQTLVGLGSFGSSTTTSVLNGATLKLGNDLTLGNFVIADGGTLDMLPQTLTLTTYEQAATGALSVTLNGYTAGSGYSQINVSGNASLNGTLNVHVTGGFVPAVASVFHVVNYGSRAGEFSIITNDLNPADRLFLFSLYNPNDLSLFVITPKLYLPLVIRQ